MGFFSPVFVVMATAFALFLVGMTLFWSKPHQSPARFASIDGLRGFLAFFVFLHHAIIWHHYSLSGRWELPPSYFVTHLGQASVALFFMITGFLFTNKLLETERRGFDWDAFLVGRIFRLTPLYFCAMAIVFLFVGFLSGWRLNAPWYSVLKQMLTWLGFSVFGGPAINGIGVSVIVAGVTWSLPYEWFFYLALPLVALLAGRRAPPAFVALAAVAVFIGARIHLSMHLLAIFAGGMVAAGLIRTAWLRPFATSTWGSPGVALCLLMLPMFPTAFDPIPVLLLTIAFCLIAGGADLFGILTARTSRRFGELAYSMYLLHGIVLYVVFEKIIGRPQLQAMTSLAFWACVCGIVPVVLGISTLGFRLVELPGIQLGRSVTDRMRTHARRHGRQADANAVFGRVR
jgi:peptidoglycan/LPS O-acetylase OafA/YrhL